MVWHSKRKTIGVKAQTGHTNTTRGVAGRPLGIVDVSFTPLEFFGAAARCSHMHFVNPALATPESQMIAALVEQYVDDVSSDFAILSTADSFKDFIKSYFVGSVSAGLAYLAMIQDGYTWVDHFENVVGGNPLAKRSPDFVFTGNGIGTALLESKGTRASGLNSFDSYVEAGYLGQVEPHLGHPVNGVCATHGYAVGSWLTSTTKAELLVHHTAPTAVAGRSGGDDVPSLVVQRHNYATAFALVEGPELSAQIRANLIEAVPPLLRFRWLGRTWITGVSGGLPSVYELDFHPALRRQMFRRPWPRPMFGPYPFFGFAMEAKAAKAVLSGFTGGGYKKDEVFRIEPLSHELRERARRQYDGRSGAIFPDGLAIVDWRNQLENLELVEWRSGDRDFEPISRLL